jgi:hypothetical protein
MTTWITRDGKRIAGPFDTENQAFGRLLSMVGYSVDHATKHEGYGFEEVDEHPFTPGNPEAGEWSDMCTECGHHLSEHEEGEPCCIAFVTSRGRDHEPDCVEAIQFEDCKGHAGGCGSPSCLTCSPDPQTA